MKFLIALALVLVAVFGQSGKRLMGEESNCGYEVEESLVKYNETNVKLVEDLNELGNKLQGDELELYNNNIDNAHKFLARELALHPQNVCGANEMIKTAQEEVQAVLKELMKNFNPKTALNCITELKNENEVSVECTEYKQWMKKIQELFKWFEKKSMEADMMLYGIDNEEEYELLVKEREAVAIVKSISNQIEMKKIIKDGLKMLENLMNGIPKGRNITVLEDDTDPDELEE